MQVVTIHIKSHAIIFGVTLAWVGCLFYLLLEPLPRIPGLEPDLVSPVGHYGSSIVLSPLIYLLASTRAVDFPGRARAAAIAIAFSVALGIAFEILQLLVPGRGAQITDVLFAFAGATTGAQTILIFDQLNLRRSILSGATVGLTLTLISLVGVGTVLLNPSFPEVVDCETAPSPPPSALDLAHLQVPDTAYTPLSEAKSSTERVTDGLVLLYDFNEASGTIVHDVSGVGTPLDLVILDTSRVRWLSDSNGLQLINPGSAIKSGSSAGKVHTALTATNQFTLETWVSPASLTQEGPVRIITMSEGTQRHQVNFHLGQQGPAASLRVRTICDYRNSTLMRRVFTDTGRPWHVVLTYDGAVERTFVYGAEQETRQSMGGDFSNWDPNYPLLIGNEATLDRPYLGEIFLVSLYDRALSNAEIQRNFSAGALARAATRAE